jgi:hypothetical protein
MNTSEKSPRNPQQVFVWVREWLQGVNLPENSWFQVPQVAVDGETTPAQARD